MLLLIDNYDSFTYNLVQYFGELGIEVKVARNDQISLETIRAMAPRHLVISPGPCTPNEAGISVAAVQEFSGQIPFAWRLSGAPEHRAGVRRHDRPCNQHHAREDFIHSTPRRGVV